MKLLNKETENIQQIIETLHYEIDGVNPDHAVFEVINNITNSKLNTTQSLKSMLQGKEYKHYHPKLVKPEFFTLIQTQDPFQPHRNTILWDTVLSKVEMDFSGELVWISHYDHTMLDKNLKPLAFCRRYGYISSYFSNEYVDLNDDFLNFLRNHPWVMNKDEIEVEEIPYYNAEEGRDRYIEVALYPDDESYQEMVKYQKSQKGYCNLRELVSGSPCIPNAPDWFGIRSWMKKKQ